MSVISIQSQVAFGHVGNSAAVFPMQMHGIDVTAVPTTLLSNRLSPLADIITPNHFEFEWLCGAKATTSAQVIGAAQALMTRGPSTVVVTSAELEDTPGGEIETVAIEKSGEAIKAWRAGTPKLPISPSGTGDLFAALFVAARVREKTPPDPLGPPLPAPSPTLDTHPT